MREIVFFIASLAGAAILTALAVLLQPDSPIWKWVLWAGIAIFAACAFVLLIDLVRPGGRVLFLAGMGAGVALFIGCAIAIVFEEPTQGEQNVVALSLAQQVADAITGGKSFCYFKVMPSLVKNLDEPFQWWIQATGNVYEVNYWVSPASAKRDSNDPAYYSLDVRKPLHQIIYKGVRAWDRAYGANEFFIDFDAKNGHWLELLKISIVDGKLAQHITVFNDKGQVIYASDSGDPP
jgi:hypothetical protein